MEICLVSQTTTVHFLHYYISIIIMEARLVKLWDRNNLTPHSSRQNYKSPLYQRASNYICKGFHIFSDIHQWYPLLFSYIFLCFVISVDSKPTILHLLQINLKLSCKQRFLPKTKLNRKQKEEVENTEFPLGSLPNSFWAQSPISTEPILVSLKQQIQRPVLIIMIAQSYPACHILTTISQFLVCFSNGLICADTL